MPECAGAVAPEGSDILELDSNSKISFLPRMSTASPATTIRPTINAIHRRPDLSQNRGFSSLAVLAGGTGGADGADGAPKSVLAGTDAAGEMAVEGRAGATPGAGT